MTDETKTTVIPCEPGWRLVPAQSRGARQYDFRIVAWLVVEDLSDEEIVRGCWAMPVVPGFVVEDELERGFLLRDPEGQLIGRDGLLADYAEVHSMYERWLSRTATPEVQP
jgi:hypothetical protein